MREWCLNRWPENSTVDLAKDLPIIKAEIRMSNAEEEMRLREEQAQGLEMGLPEGHDGEVDAGLDETVTQENMYVPTAQTFQPDIPKRCKMTSESSARPRSTRAPLRKL